RYVLSFPTRRSSDLKSLRREACVETGVLTRPGGAELRSWALRGSRFRPSLFEALSNFPVVPIRFTNFLSFRGASPRNLFSQKAPHWRPPPTPVKLAS